MPKYPLQLKAIFYFLIVSTTTVCAQGNLHHQSAIYEWPEDSAVKAKLEHWRDQKFGMIIHWGLYAVPGMIESWALCSEDWINRDSTISYDDFKKWYWGLRKDFNPVNFDPDQWALAAKSAGMRYVVFTTKHHDGFNMFDTKESDFKITNGPFANHPKANVAKFVFESFRKNDFMIGAYFSKPDWHSEYYWWPRYATADRNVNYDIRKNPWRWNKFKDFTFNQIQELLTEYGTMDILWLDGGWVRPLDTVTPEVRSWGARIPEWSQDIDMPKVAAMAREAQPGILIVDRTVHGRFENYQTPEQRIPQEKLDYPWESCITLGDGWGYIPDDKFKSSTTVIHTLIEIVAKGGSLLLGVGPSADGTLSEEQVARLKEIGTWLEKNGDAIYATRSVDHYRDGETFFTKGKNGKLYAMARLPESGAIPEVVTWSDHLPQRGTKVTLLDTGENLRWRLEGKVVKVFIPRTVKKKSNYPALAISFEE